jgi:hypothetical protein
LSGGVGFPVEAGPKITVLVESEMNDAIAEARARSIGCGPAQNAEFGNECIICRFCNGYHGRFGI